MIRHGRDKWRIGNVSFLNARPFGFGLAEHPRVELSFDVPSRLSERLEREELDVALIPAIDYFRLTAEALERHRLRPLVIMPGLALGSDGPVGSVRVFCRADYPVLRHVALDPRSHTSNCLARLILNKVYDVHAHYRWPLPDPWQLDEESDAFLLIGDAALTHDRKEYIRIFDLGEAWQRHTHRPFVYAVWAAGEADDLAELAGILNEAKTRGLAAREALAREAAAELGLPEEQMRRYLYENMRYDLGPAELAGLERFYRWAATEELAPPNIPIRLFGATETRKKP